MFFYVTVSLPKLLGTDSIMLLGTRKISKYERIDNAAYKQAVDSARKMKAKGYATQDIAEITGLTAEEIEAL